MEKTDADADADTDDADDNGDDSLLCLLFLNLQATHEYGVSLFRKNDDDHDDALRDCID